MGFSPQRLARQAGNTRGICVACHAGLLLVLLATGCASLARRQSPSPPLAANVGQRTLTDSGLKQFIEQQSRELLDQWPLQTWDFPRLTLAASYFNPGLVSARRQWQRAEIELAAAHGQPKSDEAHANSFPANALLVPFETIERKVDAAPPHGEQLAPAHTNVESPPRLSSKGARRIAETERAAQSARRHLETVAWQVRAALRTNVIAYVAVQRGISLLEEMEATCVKLVDSHESRPAPGALSSVERSLLRLQLAQTRLLLIQARLERMDARVRLAESLSLPVNVLFDVEVEFDFSQRPMLFLTARDLRWQALHSRPDVLTALANYTEAENALRQETSKRTPHTPFLPGCSWDEGKNRWKINTELGFPARQRISRNAARADARRLAAAARLLTLQADISDDVERSAAVYRVTAEGCRSERAGLCTGPAIRAPGKAIRVRRRRRARVAAGAAATAGSRCRKA